MATEDATTGSSAELQPETLELRARVAPERWSHVREQAEQRVWVLEQVRAKQSEGKSLREALAAVAPETHWSTFRYWRRCEQERSGAAWERQLDLRVAPAPEPISDQVQAAATALRQVKRDISIAEAQRHLVAQFGPEQGKVSGTSLKRIWRAAGLSRRPGRTSPAQRTHHAGGAGLALLLVAAAETGVMLELAAAVLEHGKLVAVTQGEVGESAEPEERDAQGRFTPAYNQAVSGAEGRDPRWASDAEKRERRRLVSLSVLRSRRATLARKLLSMGLAPLLTERRGFEGLDGPNGEWLALLGGRACLPATFNRLLTELALLDSGSALWPVHAQQWERLTRAWWTHGDRPRWLRWAVYVDATQDPYWTHRYAASGKVSRVGKVMPCVTRVALMGGGGVPLVVETRVGAVSLKKELLPFLERVEAALGQGEIGRLTVVDGEMSTVALMMALSARTDRWFITVLKGVLATHARRSEEGDWEAYRQHDQLRELVVHVNGAGAPKDGLRLRAVEMVRRGSRNPTSTLFVTDADPEELSTEEIASAYLSRWPHQEQRFRDARNGVGLDRSHGYGGELVTHVGLETALEKAIRRVERERTRVAATAIDQQLSLDLKLATERQLQGAASCAVRRAERDLAAARRSLAKAERELRRLQTTPREIYMRDTTRDGIMTCLKLTVLMLLEFVLKEYFGGLRMEARTFIERYVNLPVTVRKTPTQLVYQLQDNPRSPSQAERLQTACDEVNRRRLQLGRRRIRLEVRAWAKTPDRSD